MDLYKKLKLLTNIYSAVVTVDTPEPLCTLIMLDTVDDYAEAKSVINGVFGAIGVSYSFGTNSSTGEGIYSINGHELLSIRVINLKQS